MYLQDKKKTGKDSGEMNERKDQGQQAHEKRPGGSHKERKGKDHHEWPEEGTMRKGWTTTNGQEGTTRKGRATTNSQEGTTRKGQGGTTTNSQGGTTRKRPWRDHHK